MRKVLVVDDDAHIRDVVCFALRRAGFDSIEAANGSEAIAVFRSAVPDLVILDVLMPELDGVDVCRAIREDSQAPIIFLSSKDAEVDRIVGLEVGGDDYVTKPFSPRELVARVRAQLRRIDSMAAPLSTEIAVGPLRLDTEAMTASVDGQDLSLTRTEFGLLTTLARKAGKVLRREALMNGAYDRNRIVSDRTIDSHVRRLREKLKSSGPDPIQTVHGVGFRLSFD